MSDSMSECNDCGANPCKNGDDCWYLNNHSNGCSYCHCSEDNDDYDYIEVKCWSNKIYPGDAKSLVKQGVSGVLCGGEISDNAKAILDKAGIWYEENVEPHELERAIEDGEAEW
jgi:hypothetical protein